jgi:hypothetical protein
MMDAIGRRSYEIAVAQLRKRLVTGDGRDVVVHASHPLDLHLGNVARADHATDTRKQLLPPAKTRLIG